MARTNTYLQLRLSKEDKEFIKNKAEELGYPTVSSFLIDSAKDFIKIQMDLSDYQQIAREMNYIGKNINSLVRRINTDGFYTNTDLTFIEVNLEKINELIKKEFARLLKEKKKYMLGNFSKKEKQELIESFKESNLPVPKRFLLEEIYEMIRKDINYLCEVIRSSPLNDDGLDEYLLDYVNEGKTLSGLSEEELIKFSDELFFYTQKIKRKMDDLRNDYDDDDWYELKDILDEYEIY